MSYRIKGIALRHFRGVTGRVDDLPMSALFTGLNGGGKTRVAHAIQMALMDMCQDAAGKKIRLKRLVGNGETSAGIELTLGVTGGDWDAHDVIVSMNIDGKSSPVEFTTPDGAPLLGGGKDEMRALFWKKVGIDRTYAELALNPRRCLLGPEIEPMLIKLISGDKDIAAALEEFAGAHWLWLSEYIAPGGPGPDGYETPTRPADFDALGERVFAHRKGLKPKLEDLEREREALKYVIHPMNRARTERLPITIIPKMNTKLATLEAKVVELTMSLGASGDGLDRRKADVQIRLDVAQEKLSAATTQLVNWERKVKEAGEDVSDQPILATDGSELRELLSALVEQREILGEARTNTRAGVDSTMVFLANRTTELESAERVLISASEETCPTCDRKLAAGKIAAAKKRVQATIDKIKEQISEFESSLERDRADLAKCEGRIEENEAAQKTHRAELESIEAADASNREAVEKTRSQSQAETLEAETQSARHRGDKAHFSELVDSLRVELEELEAVNPDQDHAATQEKIDKLQERIAEGKGKIDALTKVKARDELDVKIEHRHALLAQLEWAVQAFEKRDFQKQQLGGAKEHFEAKCNEYLRPFGYVLSVDVSGKHAEIWFGKIGEEKDPIAECSNGQVTICSLAVGMTFAQGGVVVIDNANDLDAEHKWTMMQMLRKAEELGVCVIVAGALALRNLDPAKLAESMAPMRVVMVADGQFPVEGVPNHG